VVTSSLDEWWVVEPSVLPVARTRERSLIPAGGARFGLMEDACSVSEPLSAVINGFAVNHPFSGSCRFVVRLRFPRQLIKAE
jgi:hypothetical protein